MTKLFQCTLCEERFTYQDVKALKFFPSTCICNSCYKEAQKDKEVCFAKAFDRHNLACTKICPDRKICKLFIRLKRYER